MRDVLCVGENTERLIFFLLRKRIKKEKCNDEVFKSYSLRFVDNVRLINDSLDSAVGNLLCNLYNAKCRYWMKCKDCKKCENWKDDGNAWYEKCKPFKKLLDYCKDCCKIYEGCKGCLEYEEVRGKHFAFEC